MKNSKKIVFYLFTFFMIILLFSALYTGEYILWISFLFMFSVYIIDFLSLIFMFFSLSIKQKVSDDCLTRNEVVTIKIKANFNSFLFNHKKCNCYCIDKNNVITQVENSFQLKAEKVGRFYFGIDFITYNSFLNLFSKKYFLKNKKANCLVLPILKNLSITNSSSDLTNDNAENITIGNEDYIGARPYVFGDSLKNINFKKSSVLRKTIVNQYENSYIENSVNIFVDVCTRENYTEVAEAVLAIYNYSLKENNICNINYFNGAYFQIKSANTLEVAKLLASFDFSKKISYTNIENLDAIIISQNNITEPILEKLNKKAYIYLSQNAINSKNEIENKIRTYTKNNLIFLDETNLNLKEN